MHLIDLYSSFDTIYKSSVTQLDVPYLEGIYYMPIE